MSERLVECKPENTRFLFICSPRFVDIANSPEMLLSPFEDEDDGIFRSQPIDKQRVSKVSSWDTSQARVEGIMHGDGDLFTKRDAKCTTIVDFPFRSLGSTRSAF